MDITIMKSNKRSRDSNWSETEKQLLKELVKDHIQIIENKTNDSRALMQKKKVWSEVQQQLAAEGFVREMNRIKEQWGRMKLTAKGSISKYKKHQKGTGGGGPSKDVPTESDWEIRDMIPYEFEDDVAEFDSDALPVHSTAFESDGTEIVLNYETGELTEAALDTEDYQMQITSEVPTKNMKTAVEHVAKTPKILRPRVMKKNLKSAINKSVVENAIIENRVKRYPLLYNWHLKQSIDTY